MKTRSLHLGLLLAALALALIACTGEEETEVPPCTPLESAQGDPCEGRIEIGTKWNDPVRSHSLGAPDEPYTIREELDGFLAVLGEAHIVVRGQYTPNTVRCVQNNTDRRHPYSLLGDYTIPTGLGTIECYADIAVAEYIVGSGPSILTVLAVEGWYWDRDMTAEQIEAERKLLEMVLLEGFPDHLGIDLDFDGIAGIESVFFLGPADDAGVEVLETFSFWDVEREGDSVIVVHPYRDYWSEHPDYEGKYRSQVEQPLSTFRVAAQAAHAAMITEYGGRIDKNLDHYDDDDLPMLVTNVADLHNFYVETGATAHPEGPPALPPPITCGLVQNDADLLADCEALLPTRDTLRGTAELNWVKGYPIDRWDGVTVEGTPRRITKLELANKSLTGSIPAALARLGLTTLKLADNTLTGCIPRALRDTPTHDLDDLGLPDCPE